jgi:hypothetical protein
VLPDCECVGDDTFPPTMVLSVETNSVCRTDIDVDPATQQIDSPPTYPPGDKGELVEYRTLSVLAVISAVLGLMSPLGLLAPLLLAIAFFGAAASLIALRRMAASDGLLAGRGMALLGLALCVASIGAVSSRAIVTRHVLFHQVETVAVKWFDLLQSGQAEQAFALTSGHLSVVPAAESKEATGEDDSQSHAMELFLENPLVRAVTAVGGKAKVRCVRNLAIDVDHRGLGTVQQLYTVLPGQPGKDSFEAKLTLRRAWGSVPDRPVWLITSYELEGTSSEPAEGG